ncbi:MAG: ribosome small subunit-dependent GTPase A [Planctomycetota bacterium]
MGRKHPDGDESQRKQASKQPRGFARGHGVHHRHRPGRDAPHAFGTGRDRAGDDINRGKLTNLPLEELENLGNIETAGDIDRRIEESDDAGTFGTALKGVLARGLVLEVRKGNFLTKMLSSPTSLPNHNQLWKSGDILRTFVRGTLQQFDLGLASLVAPGDEIEVVVPPLATKSELIQAQLHAILTRVLPRRNEFRRLHPSGRTIQTLAANIDRVLIVVSAAEPAFRPGFIDRVLTCAIACDVPAALVMNKIDLGIAPADDELLDVYRGLGLPVFKISLADLAAPQGDFEALQNLLANSRTLLCGHSGVGKSTLLLALDSTLSMDVIRIGNISAATNKGIHTTTHGRLHELRITPGRDRAATPPSLTDSSNAKVVAQVIDTPGVREFTPADTDRRNLWICFPEIAHLKNKCAFANCTHIIEKNCAILAAVEAGDIHPRRYLSYTRIYETLPN